MSTLLAITFDRNIVLIQSLRHWKLDFKGFPTVYYMSDSDNRARNGERLKLMQFFSSGSGSGSIEPLGRVNRSGPGSRFWAVPLNRWGGWTGPVRVNRSAVLWSGFFDFFRRFHGSGNFFPAGSRFRGSVPVRNLSRTFRFQAVRDRANPDRGHHYSLHLNL